MTLSNDPGSVVALAIDGTSGVLTEVSGSPFAAGNGPAGITTTGAAAVSTVTLVSLQLRTSPLTIHDVVAGLDGATAANGQLQ